MKEKTSMHQETELPPIKQLTEDDVMDLLKAYESYSTILKSGGPHTTTINEQEKMIQRARLEGRTMELQVILFRLGQKEQVLAIETKTQ